MLNSYKNAKALKIALKVSLKCNFEKEENIGELTILRRLLDMCRV